MPCTKCQPVRLAATALEAIRDRNGIDTKKVDDVVLGCVDPVGEAGGDIARAAVFAADYDTSVPGMQINRFCASGLDAVNMASAQVMSGQHKLVIAGGVGKHEPCRAWRIWWGLADRAAGCHSLLLHAARRFRRPDRNEVRL